MPEKFKITPLPGKQVRNPKTKAVLPESGIVISDGDDSTYWYRREQEGSVVISKVGSEPKASAHVSAPSSVVKNKNQSKEK